jgi:aconitase (EC 4.2.1.3)
MSSTLREASKDALHTQDKTYHYYSLPLAANTLGDISRLPKSLKVLLETYCAGRMGILLLKKISKPWPGGWKLPMSIGR